jgi:hypothetical protein
MGDLTKEGYLKHLIDIKYKISDFMAFIDDDKVSYFNDISLKLRILYMRKSGTNPLLQTIQSLYNFDISVWILYSPAEAVEKGLMKDHGFIKQYHNGPMFWFEKGKEMNNIVDAFNRDKAIQIEDHFFSVKKIVEVVADKMGGAHIDEKVSDIDLLPHSNNFLIGNLNLAQRAIYDTAENTVKAISIIEEFIETNKENVFIIKR